MMNRKNILMVMTLVQALWFSQTSFANENYSSYDDIVKELESSNRTTYVSNNSENELIMIHAAFGLVTSHTNFNLPANMPQSITLQGYETQVGIDLFTPRWIAMGSVRAFDQEAFSSGSVRLNEFDIVVINRSQVSPSFFLNIGAGMSARYMEFEGKFSDKFTQSNTTPSSVFTFGLDGKMTKALSLGAHMSYRSALVHDTADDGSVDGTVRVTGHF